jgi:phosphoadenosine phosphosulfate reductase
VLKKARELINRLADVSHGKALVGLSGGKDSLVILDLLCESKRFDTIEAFYMYVIRDLEFFEQPAKLAARRHDVPLHFVPHPMLSKFLSEAECRLHVNRKIPKLKQTDIELMLRRKTNIDWFVFGHRKTDSLHRRGMLSACDNFDTKGRRCYPIGDWAPKDVHAYLRARNIPIPVPLTDGSSNGFDLRPQTLKALREKSPLDYARVLKVFPFADAQLVSESLYGKDGGIHNQD